MKNPNTNPSHSFTEGAEYEPGLMQPKPITAEHLLKKDFQQVNHIAYRLTIKQGIFHAVVLHVEIDLNCIVVSMTITGCDKWTILPHETEQQLNKLINALQGK